MCQWDVREPPALAVQAKTEGTPIPIDEVPLPVPRPLAAGAPAEEHQKIRRRRQL
jgi:hypothetical protein